MIPFSVDPLDRAPGAEPRLDAAAERFEGWLLQRASGPNFEEAYGSLWGYFGPRGELERRDVIEGWMERPIERGPLTIRYRLCLWRERATGALAAVRDCYVGVDRQAARAVVLLSHSLVMPPFRRSGIASLVRTAPATLARRDLAADDIPSREAPVLLLAEMELVDPSDAGSLVRLIAYGRAGFGAVPPEILPYCQPDFREILEGQLPCPLPLACVVRLSGPKPGQTVPVALLQAMIDDLEQIHLRSSEPSHTTALAAVDRARLAALGAREVALLPLPRSPAEIGALVPLLKSRALTHYPDPPRPLPDPDADLAALFAAARTLASESP